MVTYGFYDSLNGDRKYSAIQFGSMFDGMVRDGIFMSIGTCFRVKPGSGMMVQVGIGRAWFNHTWILNDAILPITLNQSELILNRIDAIVIDIDQRQESRKNSILYIKGTPATNPAKPALINNSLRHQYPLAYITVGAKVTAIRAADIESAIGTSKSPYVTGLLDTVNIDALLDQWKDQYLRFYEQQTKLMTDQNNAWIKQWQTYYNTHTAKIDKAEKDWEKQLQDYYNKQVADMNKTNADWKNKWKQFYNQQVADMENMEALWIEAWEQFYAEQTADIEETNEYWKRTWLLYFNEKKDEINATKLAWETQWAEWYDAFTSRADKNYAEWEATWKAWYNEYVSKMDAEMDKSKKQWETWFLTYTNENQQDYLTWKDGLDAGFKRWLNSLQTSLNGDAATILAGEIAKLKEQIKELEDFRDDVVLDNVMWNPLFDNVNREILDSEGKVIKARTKLLVVSNETIANATNGKGDE